ncbi:MAG: HNH endonuclease, partial [Afipia sp.]|nr:HNH endonuclease [Afipia sp.]
NFTLQYPLLLAPVRVSDPEPVVLRKLQIVSDFIDILIARRIWNFRAIDYSTMQYAMFLVMKEIRGLGVEELAAALTERLHGIEDEAPAFSENFYLHGTNGKQIHRLLARMTDYVETRSGQASRYREYSIRGRGGYEVEHIWADHPARHKDEFENPSDFDAYRNRIGGLLLLPKSFNASYGDLPYEDKRPHYLSQNLLARSLHDQCYQHNPGFVRMVTESGLPFRAHAAFKRADLDERQNLYMKLAERVWSPARLTGESANVQ